jgi:hypothetical protein
MVVVTVTVEGATGETGAEGAGAEVATAVEAGVEVETTLEADCIPPSFLPAIALASCFGVPKVLFM